MLHNQLVHVRAGKRALAGKQLLVNDCQAVLIAKTADKAVESLRSGVDRRDSSGYRRGHPLQVLDQAEVRHFYVVVNQENVLRFDVEVLKAILVVHQVEGFGALLHDAKQLRAGNALQSL